MSRAQVTRAYDEVVSLVANGPTRDKIQTVSDRLDGAPSPCFHILY